MVTTQAAFYLCLVFSLSISLWIGKAKGKELTLGVGIAVSCVSASWFEISIAAMPINVWTATSVLLLIAFCFQSGSKICSPLTGLDLLIAAISIWHVWVDVSKDVDLVEAVIRSYGEWVLPYTAGRYALCDKRNLAKLAPWFSLAAVVLAIFAVIECVFQWNAWSMLFAPIDDRVSNASGVRYGAFYRAHGNVRHPIFLGILLTLLLPWAVVFCETKSSETLGKWFGLGLVLIVIVGVFATVSRGPILFLALAFVFASTVRFRFLRWTVVPVVLLGFGWALVNTETLIQSLDSGLQDRMRSEVLQLDRDSEPIIQSTTRNRILVLQVYGPIFLDGGITGYGTVDSAGFPPVNLPGLPADPVVRRRIGIVDKSYLNVGLRFGYVGFVLFVVLICTAITKAIAYTSRASTYLHPAGPYTVIAFGTVLFGIAMQLSIVYLDRDFSFMLLFNIGVVSAITSRLR